MGKRPYYVIMWHRDYDGHEHIIEYVGVNYKAAQERFKYLFEFLYQRDFIDEGVNADRIERHMYDFPPVLQPGQSVYGYINDQDCYYIDLELKCLHTGKFHNQHLEDRYKQDFPNSKY